MRTQGIVQFGARALLSILAFVAYGWINHFLHAAGAPLAAQAAGAQFDDSLASWLQASVGMDFFGHLGVPLLLLVVVLALIWWRVLKDFAFPLIVLATCVIAPGDARAFYDKTDRTEAYYIKPNESAFWIPDEGANKSTQTKFGSEAYYNERKVAAKRFVIPHAKLSGSNGIWADFYVPTGRLVIVDRTPYNREWAAAHDRGTSAKNEAFPCQSAEGLDITVEISIGASVTEDNAAKFLYWFGVRESRGGTGDDPATIFASVYHGRSLTEVMDTVGRGKVQALACREITSRHLDDVNAQAGPIMGEIEKSARTFFESRGITLDYIGWAGTFTFDRDVQQAINDRYRAEKIAPVMATLERTANIEAKRGLAEGLRKGLPSFLPPSLAGWITDMFRTDARSSAGVSQREK